LKRERDRERERKLIYKGEREELVKRRRQK
jgi:hypothetical protein